MTTIQEAVNNKRNAKSIQALNETLLANKTIGNYMHLENLCIDKLELLIKKIK